MVYDLSKDGKIGVGRQHRPPKIHAAIFISNPDVRMLLMKVGRVSVESVLERGDQFETLVQKVPEQRLIII